MGVPTTYTMAIKQKVRKGKRKWYPIHAPALFNQQLIGETMVWETEAMLDKPLKVNVMSLTGNPKKQNMEAHFIVTDVKEGVAHTKATGLHLQHNAAKRLARKGRSKVSDSFLAKTANDELIRIKPIIMTRSKADNAIQRALRAKAKQVIRAFTAQYNIETLITEIVQGRLQRFVKDQLEEVFPVRSADIRSLQFSGDYDSTDNSPVSVEYALRKKNLKKDASDAIAALRDEVEAAMAQEDDDEEDEDDEEDDIVSQLKKDIDVSSEEVEADLSDEKKK